MLDRVLRWGSYVFVGFTLALLALSRAEGVRGITVPENADMFFMIASALTLPLALAKVVRESDAKSRRNWALLLGLCIVIIGLAYVFHT